MPTSGANKRRTEINAAQIAVLQRQIQALTYGEDARRRVRSKVGSLAAAVARIESLEEQVDELRLMVAALLSMHQLDESWDAATFQEVVRRLDETDGTIDGKLADTERAAREAKARRVTRRDYANRAAEISMRMRQDQAND